jgi:hypothetical protein
MSTSKPPRARKPFDLPVRPGRGSAGSSTISPPCDCSSISAMAAVAPKLPSIWNGGCASSMLDRCRPHCCVPIPARPVRRRARRAWPAGRAAWRRRGRRRAGAPRMPSSRPSTSRCRRRRAHPACVAPPAASCGVRSRSIWRPGYSAYRCETWRWVSPGVSSTGSFFSSSHSSSWPQLPTRGAASRSRMAARRVRNSGSVPRTVGRFDRIVEQVPDDLLVVAHAILDRAVFGRPALGRDQAPVRQRFQASPARTRWLPSAPDRRRRAGRRGRR